MIIIFLMMPFKYIIIRPDVKVHEIFEVRYFISFRISYKLKCNLLAIFRYITHLLHNDTIKKKKIFSRKEFECFESLKYCWNINFNNLILLKSLCNIITENLNKCEI